MSDTPVHALGRSALSLGGSLRRVAGLFLAAAGAALSGRPFNPAVRSAALRQLYNIAVAGLPGVLLAALALGSVAVHLLFSLLTTVGAYEVMGVYLTRAMLAEVAPLAVSLLVLLRSAPATVSEVALMHVSGETATLRMLGVDQAGFVHLPRLLAYGVAGPCLTVLFALVGLGGGFLVMGYAHDVSLAVYLDLLVYGVEARSLVQLVAKPLVMCLLIGGVALDRAGRARTAAEAPGLLIQTMGRCLAAVVAVEIVFLAVVTYY
jgi:phospholipid/cholesterol/gamma-HCH transport system permease protein